MEDSFDRFAGVDQLPSAFDNTRSYEHRTDAWLSPPHWMMEPMATRLNVAAALELPVLKGRPSVVKSVESILNKTSKPQKQIYNIIKNLANPETPNDMIRRIGIMHLFSDKLLSDHPTWEKRLLSGLDDIALFSKKSGNRFGAMQILRFFRNAFISPSRMHTVDRCHFCFEPDTTSNIGYVFE